MEPARVVEKVTGPAWAPAACGGLPLDDPLRAFDGQATDFGFKGDSLGEVLGEIIGSWPMPGTSNHMALEVAAAFTRARPLDPGAAVPGCACPVCTGVPDEVPAWTRRTPAYTREVDRWASWETRVEKARALPLLDVVQRLGLGTPQKQGKELVVCCPLHKDRRPSLQLNPVKQLWYCHPCGEGGDGLRLFMRTRRLEFADAVRELVA